MTVLSFIKENRVLVAGLILPLLLIGILAVAKALPASMVPLPEHKVMYFSSSWSGKGQIAVKVDNDRKIQATFNANTTYEPSGNIPDPKAVIYLYDPKTNTVEDTTVTLDKDGKVTALDKFEDIQLLNQTTSPDGYLFEPYRYRNHSMLTDIFSYRSYSSGPSVSKNGRVITIPQPQTYYGQIEFLGWEASK